MDTLYNIEAKIADLTAKFQAGDIDEQAYQDSVDSLIDGSLQDKLVAYAHIGENAKALALGQRNKIKEWAGRAAKNEALADKMFAIVKERMQAYDLKTIETDDTYLHIQNAGGQLGINIDGDHLQADMFKTELRPDKDKIRRALAAGHKVVGAEFKPRGIVLRMN